MDVFEWSIPFVAEKVSSLMYHLVQPGRTLEEKDKIPLAMIDRKELLEKMLTYQKGVTEENTELISYGGRTLDSELLKMGEAKEYTQRKHKKDFVKKKEIDSKNEMRPTERK